MNMLIFERILNSKNKSEIIEIIEKSDSQDLLKELEQFLDSKKLYKELVRNTKSFKNFLESISTLLLFQNKIKQDKKLSSENLFKRDFIIKLLKYLDETKKEYEKLHGSAATMAINT